MRTLLIYSLFFVLNGCSTRSKKIEFNPDNLVVDTSGYVVKLKGNPDSLFPIYMDSVNQFKSGMPLPSFFYNHMLDYENPWLTDHHSWSLRKMIFDSTRNIELIEAMVKSNDFRLRRIIEPDSVGSKELLDAIPYAAISNFQMAMETLNKLKVKN